MGKIHIQRAHKLGKASARKSAEHISAKLKNELNVGCQWHGDELKLSHASAHGSILVDEAMVEVRVELPFLLRPLRAKIERAIHEQLDKHLEKPS